MKYIIILFAIITTFLTPIKGLLLIMILFILADTFFGIFTSIKLGGIAEFKSHKFFNLVIKSFFYLSTIIMTFLIDRFILGGHLFGISFLLAKAMTALWIYIEIKSIDESSMKLGNKSFWELIKEMITKLSSIKKDLNDLIEVTDDKSKE